MKHILIDGNNVIGKIPELKKLQMNEPQQSRERLSFLLDRFYLKKKNKVFLHLDGHPKDAIRTNKIRIEYSYDKTADDKIREQIEHSKNPKNLIVITSDRSLSDFAKACSCDVKPAEDFASEITESESSKTEEDIIEQISDDEIKRLFDL